MSADLVSSIELLQEQKRAALAEVARIDNELERARLAIQDLLGGRPPRNRARAHQAAHFKIDGTVPNKILAALAASEPRTANDIKAYTGISQLVTVQTNCKAMVEAGRLFRARLNTQGTPAIYARTKEALNGHDASAAQPAAPEEGAADEG